MEQPAPWVQQLAEGRLEQLDELFLTLGAVVRWAVYEGIGRAFAKDVDPPQAYEPRSDRYRQAAGLEDAPPDPDTPATEDDLAAKRLARAKHHGGLDSLASFMKKPRR